MSGFLQQMAKASGQRAARLPHRYPAGALDRPLLPFAPEGFAVIAEIKPRSPSAGPLAKGSRGASARALAYAAGGAAAVSVLTEPTRFGGSLELLTAVAEAAAGAGVPVMRKDFLVDTRQVLEARAAGASGILLIAAILPDRELRNMLAAAAGQGLFVLLECFDRADLARVAALLSDRPGLEYTRRRQLLVGVNTRDLRSLVVDSGRLARLAADLPPGAFAVAESGITDGADAAAAAVLGYRGILVGTALMRARNPAALVREMQAAGRAEVAENRAADREKGRA